MTHKLKIEQCYLNEIKAGIKKSEIRFNDRNYQIGDLVELCILSETNQELVVDTTYKITHIHYGLGLKDGYVILSFELVNDKIREALEIAVWLITQYGGEQLRPYGEHHLDIIKVKDALSKIKEQNP